MRRILPLIFLISWVISSCSSSRNLVYFDDLATGNDYRERLATIPSIQIQSGDLLEIIVSSVNPETNILFNSGIILPPGTPPNNTTATPRLNEGYLVDKEGFINFPGLGKINLAGLSREQATEKMTAEISKVVRSPVVNLRLVNFKITVIGEVKTPSTFAVNAEKLNVLEALGMAGDLTEYARRDNVLIIRESNGERVATRLNLNSKQVFNSPYFYLQQNDVVYVEPYNNIKVAQSEPANRYIPIWAAAISALAFSFITFVR
ncbi:polysaccharide biosynthesis/export family protein [Telluribacter sp.]|jgi:polysaccharide export outer membrane protein|uniref:polysaccharide biosynthesis/export family protein n=1 Tax=Telluribacter sp. TaxID=1978767 RepID=UPI002E102355|nr:polysaccharide biosynthesis/export family protein [Telluribacter sp.]